MFIITTNYNNNLDLLNLLFLYLLMVASILWLHKYTISNLNVYNILYSKRNNPWEDFGSSNKVPRLEGNSSNIGNTQMEVNSQNVENENENENEEQLQSASVTVNNQSSQQVENDFNSENDVHSEDSDSLSEYALVPANEQQLPYIIQSIPEPEYLNLFNQDDVINFLIDNYWNIDYGNIDNLDRNITINNIIRLVNAYVDMEGLVRHLNLAVGIRDTEIIEGLVAVFGVDVYSLSVGETDSSSGSENGSGNFYNSDSDESMPGTPPNGSHNFNFSIENFIFLILSFLNMVIEIIIENLDKFL